MSKKNTCPICGRPVKQRNGEYGPFVGCSGFPVCRWTTSCDYWDECNEDPDRWRESERMREIEPSWDELHPDWGDSIDD